MPCALKIVIGVICLILISQTQAEPRHALIIGNSNYLYARKLDNPRNDSRDMARALRALFFKVILVQDATKAQMEKAVKEYADSLKKSGGIGLFYYAGHGVQLEGDNYLVPVETQVGSEQEIKQQSYSVARLLNSIRAAKLRTNIIILDACRDNPFKNATTAGRSLSPQDERGMVKINLPKLDSGLSELDAPPNTLIAFATAPGRVASDGNGRNSPYTAELIKAMNNTGLTIAEVFRQVRKSVVKETNDKQIPWESSSLIDDFYFKPRINIPIGF